MQAAAPGLIALTNPLVVCRNLNHAFGWQLTPADLEDEERWPPEVIEAAEALIAFWNTEKPKKKGR